MEKKKIAISRLASQLQALLELDSSLGVNYYDIAGGIEGLNLDLQSTPIPAQQQPIQQTQATEHNSTERAAVPLKTILREDVKPLHALNGSPKKIAEIEKIFDSLRNCGECNLHDDCKNAIHSQGSVDAAIAFISSAPGREEDNAGLPFQGAAGKLITDIIEKGMKMPKSSLYLSTIVKCRPKGNREPFPQEIAACKKHILQELEIVQPKIIVAVGIGAANILTDQQSPIEQTRGIWYDFNGIPVIPIYDPSFLLRQRRKLGHTNEYIRQTWNDIKQILRRLTQL